ncbi:hypothetical protein PHLGIDRAFT_305593 [Phlebiopsis gigantea 11061_1 CR5-6]|uniref:Uncharacterized protein n=1 Tax=Phlebiopsis gigantea (strain 11061_1 CR5-6) TaxID=745531 RepID=A0A0C3S043_PHLG1|nr:hypothetical protein PHLGIDRAFT_305593 [Phlebiopsis gigantea 11061_1 CR5-6]
MDYGVSLGTLIRILRLELFQWDHNRPSFIAYTVQWLADLRRPKAVTVLCPEYCNQPPCFVLAPYMSIRSVHRYSTRVVFVARVYPILYILYVLANRIPLYTLLATSIQMVKVRISEE